MPELRMTQVHLETALLPQGWAPHVRLTIDDGVIRTVTVNTPVDGTEVISGTTVAGMPNVHSHAFQRAMAGLAERAGDRLDDSFWTWREAQYGFLETLTPEDVEAIAAQAYVEMLESGFTSCVEFHYLHHGPDGQPYGNIAEMAERIVAAAETSGIGLTLLPVLYTFGGFGEAPATQGQRRFVGDFDHFTRLLEASEKAVRRLPGALIGVAPHSLRAVSPEALARVVALAGERPIHIHIAEQQLEVEDCLAWSGRRPVTWLLDEMPVGPRWCLIHATHMTREETRRVAATGTTVGLCPITEANLGDGIFPAVEYRSAAGRWGIGSDSNVLISVAEELRTLEYGQRLERRRRNLLADPGTSTSRTMYDAALAGGRAASGGQVGAIAPGYRADFVVIDADTPPLIGRSEDGILDGWIFAARQSPVREVWAGGRHVVADGRHVHREQVFRRFKATIDRIVK
jgi:formimidoylglutamate deiminase